MSTQKWAITVDDKRKNEFSAVKHFSYKIKGFEPSWFESFYYFVFHGILSSDYLKCGGFNDRKQYSAFASHFAADNEVIAIEPDGHTFEIIKVLGMRTFWCLQQNQDIQKEQSWQEKMLDIERKVSTLEDYKSVAFFHHVILRKI